MHVTGSSFAGQTCWDVTAGIPAAAGSNGTIQIEYSSHYRSGNVDGVFYACADVTFQESVTDEYYSCRNVSDADTSSSSDSSSPSSSGGSKGLSKGQKAGIAVGSIVGGAMIVAVASVCVVLRKHKRLDVGKLGLKHKRQGWRDLELDSVSLPKNAARISQ
ncbi:hypothetical protein SCUCBS95973_007021 [Sporothrix curviconia]|uniref:Copper acquisition factor BIM1-like domain-containing protein n=1 Tax=Sporothrix curviconia TaxID=1260050 RepID=A0ABP0CAB9_9PEZI